MVTAEGLKALYETELRYEVGNLGLASEERQGLWHLFSASRRMRPGELREQDHPGVWLWSDLHLGHAMTISVFGRPYSTPEEMDDALFGVWRRVVDPGDTVVILGDVAIGGLSGRRLKRFRVAPGRKVLVLGNHEFDGTVAGHLEGFDEVYSTVYVPGSPELLLTHVPLRDVPEGCVNVHGHLHKWVPSGDSAHQRGGRADAVSTAVVDGGSPPRGVSRPGRARTRADDGAAADARWSCGRRWRSLGRASGGGCA